MTAPIFDADELRAKAEASRDSWAHNPQGWYRLEWLRQSLHSFDDCDISLVATMTPAVVLALLDEIKATRAQLADERNKTREAEEDAFFKKDWR